MGVRAGERRVAWRGRWKRGAARCQVGAGGSRDNARRVRGERERRAQAGVSRVCRRERTGRALRPRIGAVRRGGRAVGTGLGAVGGKSGRPRLADGRTRASASPRRPLCSASGSIRLRSFIFLPAGAGCCPVSARLSFP